MSGRTLLGALALVVLGLLAWELRLVLLVLFGAVVLAVALDVPITLLRRLLPLSRPAALILELVVLAVVNFHRARIDVRLEGVEGIRERWK